MRRQNWKKRTKWIIASFLVFIVSCEKHKEKSGLGEDINYEKDFNYSSKNLKKFDFKKMDEKLREDRSINAFIAEFGPPNNIYNNKIQYLNWDPDELANIGREGEYGFTVFFEEDKAVQWLVMSAL